MQHYAIQSFSVVMNVPYRPIGRRHWRVIVKAIAEAYEVGVSEIMSDSRERRVAWPRQAAYHLLNKERGFKSCTIGRLMGRNHSTVLFGIEQAAARLKIDPDFAAAYERARG